MKRSLLYKSIRDRILATMPSIVYVDMNKGQVHGGKDHYPFPKPAVLIQIKSASYTDVSRLCQLGNVTVSVTLCQECMTDSFDGAEIDDANIDMLNEQDDLYLNIHGLIPGDGWGVMMRKSESGAVLKNGIAETTVEFSISKKELMPASTTTRTVPIAIKIQV